MKKTDSEWKSFLNDKEYKYKTETEKTLDNFKKEAKERGAFAEQGYMNRRR